jgi:hypothetical protein
MCVMVPDRDQISVMDSLHMRAVRRRRRGMHGPPCYRHVQARSSSPYVPEKVVLGGLEPGVVDTMATDAWMELDAHACVTYVGQSHALAHPQRRETRTGHLFCSEAGPAGTQRQAKRPERRTNRTRRRTDGLFEAKSCLFGR